MSLTQDQYDKLVANYVDSLVDGMDLDSLVQFATEQIEENIRKMFSLDEELIEEIGRFYDEDDVAAMIDDVGGNPADFGISNSLDEDTWRIGTRPLVKTTNPWYITFVPERHTMFDELWAEIQDMQGEIFDLDIPELRDEKFDVNEYLNANYDYWWLLSFLVA